MTQKICTKPELFHAVQYRAPVILSRVAPAGRALYPDLALPMSDDPAAWEMTAQFTDLEYTALALFLKKLSFADVAAVMGRMSDCDPDVADLIEYAHSALIELDDSLELAAEIGEGA